ncbi:MAG: helix-turn-helix domain-containing protein [Nevskia sp.]|nr:helix-turn-helix domain-containing protein [Nevskia sp.]
MALSLRSNTGSRNGTGCWTCPVHSCLARQGTEASVAAWLEVLAPRVAVMPGSPPLFRAGARLQSIYCVRGGCLKTWVVGAEGKERIHGFYLPGDLIGLDALWNARTASTATAVVASQVCVVPVERLKSAVGREPEISLRIAEQTSRQLAMALALSADLTAEQRLAAFLVQMAARLEARNGVFKLPMTRRDVGAYLRLAEETVSRLFGAFEQNGLLRCVDKAVQILDAQRLTALAEPGLERRQRAGARSPAVA